jgi:hypothetical protein
MVMLVRRFGRVDVIGISRVAWLDGECGVDLVLGVSCL